MVLQISKFSIFAIFFISLTFVISADAFAENNWKISIKKSSETGMVSLIPNELPIQSGDTVSWINHDSGVHKIVSGISKHPDFAGTFFSSPELKPGEKFTERFVFSQYGGYYYFCEIHPWLAGKVFFEDYEFMPESTLSLTSKLDNDAQILYVNGEVHSDFSNKKYELIIFDSQNNILFHTEGKFDHKGFIERTIDASNFIWNSDSNYFTKLIYGVPSEAHTTEILNLPLNEIQKDFSVLCKEDSFEFSYPFWYKDSFCWYEQELISHKEIQSALNFFSNA